MGWLVRVNVPLINQLTTATNDGRPSNNAQADCAAAACDAAAQALGAPANLTPDYWKDSAYGEAYTGATDPLAYGATFARFGLAIQQWRSVDGNALVSQARHCLATGQPVCAAIPSQWGTTTAADIAAHGGPTHEVVLCDDDGSSLTAMNPWGGFYQTQPYAWWASRLVYGRINPVVRVQPMAWTKQADGTGRDAVGHTCGAGIMTELESQTLTGVDGRSSETYYVPGAKAFLALANGEVVRATVGSDGQWHTDLDGAAVVMDLWLALWQAQQAAKPAPAPVPASVGADLAAAAASIASAQAALKGV